MIEFSIRELNKLKTNYPIQFNAILQSNYINTTYIYYSIILYNNVSLYYFNYAKNSKNFFLMTVSIYYINNYE